MLFILIGQEVKFGLFIFYRHLRLFVNFGTYLRYLSTFARTTFAFKENNDKQQAELINILQVGS